MKEVVLLDYMFMFDPSRTWAHLSEFETSLSKYFSENGMDVQVISVSGQSGRKVLYIKKKEEVKPIQPAKEHEVKQQLKNVGRK